MFDKNNNSPTRDKIINKASEFFRRDGYTNFRITQISRSLGISPGNLTYYFPTKDSLVEYFYFNYFKNIEDWVIKANLPIDHGFSRRLYALCIQDINIMNDEDARRFHYDLLWKPVLWNIIRQYSYDSFLLLYNIAAIRIDPYKHKYYTESNVAMFQALDKMFIEEGNFSNASIYNHTILKQQARTKLWEVYRVIPGRPATRMGVEESVQLHVEELKKHDFSEINLLP